MTTYGDSGVDDECPNASGKGGGSRPEQQAVAAKADGGGGGGIAGAATAVVHHRPAEVRPPPALVGSWEDVILALPPEHHLTATILWKLLGRAVRSEVHARQLQRYAALGTVPRGLRIKVEPLSLNGGGGGGGVDEFVAAWRDHAERSSLELMQMLVAEHERQLAEARGRAAVLYEVLRRGLTRDQYALLAGVYNGEARSELQRLQQVVESKLRRDVEEYGRARAAPPRPPALPRADVRLACGGGGCCGRGGGVCGRGAGCGRGYNACERSVQSARRDDAYGPHCPPSPFLLACGGGGRRQQQQQQHGAQQNEDEQRERRHRRDPSINSLIEEKRKEIRFRSGSGGGAGGCAFAAITNTMTAAPMGDARGAAAGVE